MTTEWQLVTATIVLGIALAGWVAYQAWKRQAEPPEYYGDERAEPVRYQVPDLDYDTAMLPSALAYRSRLSALADSCPDCGGDHPGECAPATTIITAVDAALDNENWTWIGTKLFPPKHMVDQLASDDWLRQLLTGQ